MRRIAILLRQIAEYLDPMHSEEWQSMWEKPFDRPELL